MKLLKTEEYQRYSRHLNLPDFTIEDQLLLKRAKVLVVGAGGLGSPLLLYLAAAGVGTLGIIDGDTVDESNLQRQILYDTGDIDTLKATRSKSKLLKLNPHIHINSYDYRLTTNNALSIISEYDIIADGTDNFPTRYLVNDACVISHKVNVYASIYRYEGQVSVFNHKMPDGTRSANYRDLYPISPPPGMIPDCATGGVLGVLAGIIGTMQANEVIKIIIKKGKPLYNRLIIYDALEPSLDVIHYKNRNETNISKLIDYEHFCGLSDINSVTKSEMKEITAQELKKWKDEEKDFQLVDVRESHEFDFTNIGGELIPLGNIMSSLDQIADNKPTVLMCRSGQRSAAALDALQKAGCEELYNLKGGILAWARDVDPSIPQY